MSVVLQGDLVTGDNRVVTARQRKTVTIQMIRCNISADCSFTLSKFQDYSKTTKQIYSFDLEAGDTITDTSAYLLESNDYLVINITQGTGTFYVQGVELDITTR